MKAPVDESFSTNEYTVNSQYLKHLLSQANVSDPSAHV